MRKLIAFILAGMLLLSLGAATFAESRSESYDRMGLSLTYPEEFDNVKGVFEPFCFGRVADGLYYMEFLYTGIAKEEYQALAVRDDITEEEVESVYAAQASLLYLIGIEGGRGASDLVSFLEMPGVGEESFIEVGRADDVTFFVFRDFPDLEEYTAGLAPEFAEEYLLLQEKLTEALKGARYSLPVVPGAELIGQTLTFETTDLDGNPVKSEEIFSQHELTMINIWATWCGPCKAELAGLGEMSRRLAARDVGVIGLCLDADEKLDFCKSLLEENNVDYLNLMPYVNAKEALSVISFPTSYFVDREGKVLSYPFNGAPVEMSQYESVIDSLLKGEDVNIGLMAPPQENAGGTCRVVVTDTEGKAVEGAVVQFCSDVACTIGKTDAEGAASFEAEEGTAYTVHILKVPEGYEKTDEEFAVEDLSSELHVVIRKSA